jgi:hypothetical protein
MHLGPGIGWGFLLGRPASFASAAAVDPSAARRANTLGQTLDAHWFLMFFVRRLFA